jgi:ATP phosphoribosyltransferase
MDHIEDYQDRLLFAIPKKGRLHEKCVTLLNNVDIQFHRKPRHDIALVQNFPIALIFLPASDIAKYVGEGNVDLGITGQDIVAESEAEDKVNVIQKLGFGKCKLQVQTPTRNQIQSANTLIGQRIVTSFPVVTKKYFDELEKNNSSESKTHIRFVGGSVETACALGLTQGIGKSNLYILISPYIAY